MSRKILYSPGYGAGWTSWESNPDLRRFMLEYGPIIEALERGEDLGDPERAGDEGMHPAVRQFCADCEARFGKVPYLGGVRDLRVATVSGPVRIEEYDGSESYEEPGDYQDWL